LAEGAVGGPELPAELEVDEQDAAYRQQQSRKRRVLAGLLLALFVGVPGGVILLLDALSG